MNPYTIQGLVNQSWKACPRQACVASLSQAIDELRRLRQAGLDWSGMHQYRIIDTTGQVVHHERPYQDIPE